MKSQYKIASLFLVFLSSFCLHAQEEDDPVEGSVIQNLTPSKLIGQRQYDIKWFNNLYTQNESTFSEGTEPRQTFYIGISLRYLF